MADSALSDANVPDPASPGVESVRVVAVMGMALGLSGLLCLPYRTVFEELGPRAAEGRPSVGYWAIAFSLAGLALSILLVAGSFAAFRLRPRGRPLLIAYAVGTVLFGAAAIFAYLRVLIPNDGRNLVFRWGGIGITYELTMWPLAMLFSLYVLYVMTRPRTRAAFAKGAMREGMDRADR